MKRFVLFVSAAVIVILAGCAASGDAVEATNVETVHTVFTETWSKGNLGVIDDLFAEDFVGHFPGETVHGREGLRAQVISHRTSFPDWTEQVEDTIADGDLVVVRFTSRGTNLGDFLGNPPTGNHVEISEVAIFRLQGGRIVEQWVYPDILGLQRQLGAGDEGSTR